MKKSDFLYESTQLELDLEGFQLPGRGFHTAYELSCFHADETAYIEDGEVTVTYLEGGAACGCRYTFVQFRHFAPHNPSIEYGWAYGFRLPVPIRPFPELAKSLRGLTPKPLLFPGAIPGFMKTCPVRHQDRWFTKSLLVREIPAAPVLGEGARVFILREGVYISFPDGSYRLIPSGQWRHFSETFTNVPFYRQGDLLVFEFRTSPFCWYCRPENFEIYWDSISSQEKKISYDIDRHRIAVSQGSIAILRDATDRDSWESLGGIIPVLVSVLDGTAEITHPTNTTLSLPPGKYVITPLPGTSRPKSYYFRTTDSGSGSGCAGNIV